MDEGLVVFGVLILDLIAVSIIPVVWRLASRLTLIESRVSEAAKDHARSEKLLADTNEIVRRELRPNGGESIFDRVTNIESSLTESKAKQLRDSKGRFTS